MAEVILKSKGLQLEVDLTCTGCGKMMKVPRGLHMNGILCEECKNESS